MSKIKIIKKYNVSIIYNMPTTLIQKMTLITTRSMWFSVNFNQLHVRKV